MTHVLIGATSGLARAMIRQLAAAGTPMILAARDTAELALICEDARQRGAPSATPVTLDILAPESWAALDAALSATEGPLTLGIFTGIMPPQGEIDADPALTDAVIGTSFTGPARLLARLAPVVETRGGAIFGVGSVAGDRGRLGNYTYGGAKAGFHAFLSGLRNRLGRKGIHVMTVKPGPMDTPMTHGLGKQPLMIAPEKAAAAILRGLGRKTNVLYTAAPWRYIMFVIRNLPEPIMKKLSF